MISNLKNTIVRDICGMTVALAAVLLVRPCPAANELYETLISKGTELAPQETIKLPKPTLEDGLDEAAQHQAIETLLAGRYDWETFTRKAVVSPFLLKISDDNRDAGQIARRVDLYFVTFGSLSTLAGENYLQEQLNLAAAGEQGSGNGHVRILSADDLGKRNMPTSQRPRDPRWVAVESTLLGKVLINLTTQNVKTETRDSVVIASLADPRFLDDAEYPNRWRSLTTDDAGRRQVGPPQPYGGLASYAKVTRLVEPAGALFVEYHIAFAEPQGWFHGANLLRSKLPIVSQDMVRRFRRNTNDR